MGNYRQYKCCHSKEVEASCCLTPSKYFRVPMESCAYCRRHGRPRSYHEWSKHEDNSKVGQLLQRIVWIAWWRRLQACINNRSFDCLGENSWRGWDQTYTFAACKKHNM